MSTHLQECRGDHFSSLERLSGNLARWKSKQHAFTAFTRRRRRPTFTDYFLHAKKEQLRAAGCSIEQIRSQRHHLSRRGRKKRRLYCTRKQQFSGFFTGASRRGKKQKGTAASFAHPRSFPGVKNPVGSGHATLKLGAEAGGVSTASLSSMKALCHVPFNR